MFRNSLVCVGIVAGALALASANPALAGGHGHGGGGGGGWGGGGWGHGGGGWGGGWGGYHVSVGWGGYYRPYWYGSYYWPRAYSYYYYPYTYNYYAVPYYPDPQPVPQDDPQAFGKVTVQVPEDAQVTFNDLTSPVGKPNRWYETPALRPDRDYSVVIRASWTEGGTKVERTRTLDLHAGEKVNISFLPQPK